MRRARERAFFALAVATFPLACDRSMGSTAPLPSEARALRVASSPPPDGQAAPDPTPSTTMPQSTPPQSTPIDIRADLRAATIRHGESATLVLTLTNLTQSPLFVPHPIVATGAVTLRVRLPSGEERSVTSAASFPGVPPRRANARLLPGTPQAFGIDLRALVALDPPGAYSVVVEYPWKPGETWTSSPLAFVVR